MKKNKGLISVFVLLSMMFFLIFVTVAYNNVMQKGKTQVATEGILVEYYQTLQEAYKVDVAVYGGVVTNSKKDKLLKETDQQKVVEYGNDVNNYIYSNGKIYLIQH